MRLEGKVAIITGAGRGIGRAIALAFAREGAAVIVNFSQSEDSAREVTQQIRSSGGRAKLVQANVANLEEHERLLHETVKEFGAVDVLVNNAGIEVHEPVLNATPETWQRTIDVNLRGAYFLSCRAASRMRPKGGAIINISSVHDVEPLRDRAVYSISKGGLMMLTKSLALELAEYNIRVNAISPGAILTDMNRASLSNSANRNRLLARIPLQRIGEPEEIGGAAIFLASAESSYVTGTTIYVDGGLLIG
jgi:glucose 1-dehydrogenase